jgi:two-component system sensor histidine kinase YesM
MKRPWKLKPFLLTVFISFASIFLLLAIFPVYFGVYSLITEQTSKSYLDLTYNNHQHITERLNKIEETTLSISTNRLLRQGLENHPTNTTYESIVEGRELYEWLNSYLYIHPYITSIQIYSSSRMPQTDGIERIKAITSIPWSEYLPQFDDGDSMWLTERVDRNVSSGEKTVLTYVMETFNRRGDVSGYVEVNMDEKSLWSLIEGKSNDLMSSNRMSLLFDRSGKLMTSNGFGESLANSNSSDWFLRNLDVNQFDTSLQKVNGKEYLQVFTPANRFDWRLVEIIPVEDVFRNVNNLRNRIILIGICAILLTFPAASFISNQFKRPVVRLLESFRKVENVDFNERMPTHFIVEFQELSKAHNRMMREINRLLDRVEEEHLSKRDAELRALQSQINPHFLYNTLDMINWMAAMKGNKEVSFIAAQLAKLFRISLSKSNTFIPLEEELEHGMVYARIQQARFADKFEYTETIDDRFRSCYVPRIIIQPFIENAIIHGFVDDMEDTARVVVSAESLGEDRFMLVIEDNGKGLSRAGEHKPNATKNMLYLSGSSGYGIQNVNERIKLYFGASYGATLKNREPNGVRVEIELPIVYELPGKPSNGGE